MPTPRQLRQSADRLEREGRAKLAQAQALRVAADQIEQLQACPPDESSLTSPGQYDQSDQMAQANSSVAFNQPIGKPLKSKGPIAKVAKQLGISMTELATRLNVSAHWNLRNWDKRGRVPEEIEKRLAALVEAHEKAAKAAKRSK